MRRRAAFVAAVVLATVASWSGCGSGPEPEALFAKAQGLQLSYEKEAAQKAIAKYRQAQVAWKRKGDKRNAARAGQQIGATYGQLGSLQQSLQDYLAALSLAQGSADPLLESELRSDVGFAQSLAADREEALEDALRQCQAALTLARRAGGARQEAKALNCLGEVAYHRGNLGPALEFYRQAEPVWKALDDQRGLAESVLFQGYVYSDLSELDRAQACYERAWSLWTSLRDKRGQAITVIADARLRQRRGENQAALNRFDEALALLQPMGDAVWEGASLTGKAAVYEDMADTESALKNWERALELFEKAGLRTYAIDILWSLGETHLASGDDKAALNRFERALALADQLGNRRWRAFALRDIGVVYLVRRMPRQAQPYLERSLEILRSLEDRKLEGRTRADMGEMHYLLGEYRLARQQFDDALTLSRVAGDRVGEARALFGLGRASVGLNDLDAARKHVERSLKVVESLRTDVDNRDLRASYFASVYRYHELHLDVLMRLNKVHPGEGLAAAAFDASERARARSLLDSLTEAGVDLRQGVDPALLRREAVLKKAFDDWAERQTRLGGARVGEGGDKALTEEYRDLEERYNQVQAEIRSKSPHYAALARPRPLGLKDVQRQVLDAGTLLLEYALGEERSYLWAVADKDLTSYELPRRAEIERATQTVYERLTARLTVIADQRERRQRVEQADAEYWLEAGRLSDMLLGPVAKKMVGKRILVVADGALQYLPFAALPVPGRRDGPVPMVAEHEIVSLPSASVLAVLRRETRGRKPPGRAVAVLADPVFEPDDPRLDTTSGAAGRSGRQEAKTGGSAPVGAGVGRSPGALNAPGDGTLSFPRLAATREEADAIVASAPEGMTLRAMGFAASRATAMSSELAQYRIVHFATHGVFDNENPGLSGIILSMFDERGQALDGFLRLHDIYGLKLPAELVVLSACNTALGKQVRGEGLVGVVRGFMYAGAKRVVASLWKVDDEATGELMRRFYEEMLGQNRSPAAALRQAQLAMWRQERWRPPFYWAAFVLQGEWQ